MTGNAACRHERTHFDRSLCACGVMHTYCDDCGLSVDDCPYAPVVTSPEQHAATVEAARVRLEARLAPGWKGNHPDPHEQELDRAALDELVALASEAERLAGRADELERENERLRRDPKTHPFSTGMDLLRRAEAAEARADELATELVTAKTTMKAAIWDMEAAEARVAGLQRERDEALSISPNYKAAYDAERERVEQARREADQLRAALRGVLNELGVPDENYAAPVANAVDIARAALAGVQADCDGSRDCAATLHTHGCFADKGDCDHPTAHNGVWADSKDSA